MDNKHYEHIDFLRFVAIFAVLLQHCTFHEFIGPANDCYWNLSRYNILVFVFISGYLLVPKSISPRLMWTKYIKRIAIAFAVWSLAYSVYNQFLYDTGVVESVKLFIGDFLSGGTRRMWYPVMLIGLYAIVPLVSAIFNIERYGEYFTILLFGVTILFPTICMIPSGETLFGMDFRRIYMIFPSYLPFYLVLGALMRKVNLKEMEKWWFLILCSFVLSIVVLILLAISHIPVEQFFLGYVFIAMGLYYYSLKRYSHWPAFLKRIVRSIAECSFGIYLVHTFIQYLLDSFKIRFYLNQYMSDWLVIPVYAFSLFFICWLVAFILRLTPIGRKIT